MRFLTFGMRSGGPGHLYLRQRHQRHFSGWQPESHPDSLSCFVSLFIPGKELLCRLPDHLTAFRDKRRRIHRDYCLCSSGACRTHPVTHHKSPIHYLNPLYIKKVFLAKCHGLLIVFIIVFMPDNQWFIESRKITGFRHPSAAVTTKLKFLKEITLTFCSWMGLFMFGFTGETSFSNSFPGVVKEYVNVSVVLMRSS